MSKLLDHSEEIIGLILNGKQTSTGFSPDKFAVPYQPIIKDIKDGKTQEQLYAKYGNLIQTAKHAANSKNGLGTELDYVELLNMTYNNELLEQEAEKLKRHLQNGAMEKVDDTLRRMITTRNSVQRLRSKRASEIDTKNYSPFIPSGTKSWDNHIGGFPNAGLVILGGKWGDGKTTDSILLMKNFLDKYPEKEILFVTLEDMDEGWKVRSMDLLGKNSDKFWDRIHVMEFASSPDEIIEEASRHEDVGMIFVDYIDYMAKKNMEAYDEIYSTLQVGAKSLAVASKFHSMPVLALAQFGKGRYSGGVPTPDVLMYTGEAQSFQLVMLYDPNKDFHSDNKQNPYTLPTEKGFGYLVVWKVKNGNRRHSEPQGAIQLPMLRLGGIDVNAEGSWFSLEAEVKREVPDKKH